MEIKELLAQLKKYTGVELKWDPDENPEGERPLHSMLNDLIEPYKSSNDKETFLRNFLHAGPDSEDVSDSLARLHIPCDAPACLFMINIENGYSDEIFEILRSISETGDEIICEDEDTLLLLRFPGRILSSAKMASFANMISELISSDAMIRPFISYDVCVEDLRLLPASYARTRTAMKIGKDLLYSDNIFSYHSLGVAKLIYSLPEDVCREYLSDNVPGFLFENLDSELILTIQTFFENGLSVPETAKKLFIHTNTLRYRLEKFENLSGLNPRNFNDSVVALLAMMIEKRLV